MKFFLLAVMILLSAPAFGQSSSNTIVPLTTNGGTRIVNKTYAVTTNDTTDSFDLRNYKTPYLTIQTQDSAVFNLKYQLSTDNSHWGVLTLYDSLVTASNTGNVKSWDLSSVILGSPWVRFSLSIHDTTGGQARPGVSSAKYSAYLTLKVH